jgi:hypothetical protein
MQGLADKLGRAVTNMPDAAAWRRTVLEASWLLLLLVLAGFAGGFVEWGSG